MTSPILRPLGGRYGALARMGVNITPDSDPADVGWTFTGPATFTDTVVMPTTLTVGGKEIPRIHQVAMAAVDTAGGVAAFVNPLSVPILITRLVLEWTTQSTGACTLSAGVAADATTLNSGLVSGQSVASAAGTVSSTVPKRCAANGVSGSFVTVSVASGASAGLVGRVYIEYVPIQ